MARPSRTGGKTSEAKARNASPAKGRKTTKNKRPIAPAVTRVKHRSISDPSKDLKEAREQQAATAQILKVIASSPSDVQPVLEAVAERAMSLLDAWSVLVTRFDGELLHFGAARGALPDTEQFLRNQHPMRPEAAVFPGRCVLERSAVNISDAQADPNPQSRERARLRGFRAHLSVPMLRDGQPNGVISVSRREAGAFAANEVELLQTFADQAVIAIENVRLFNETKEALARQIATADVLKVIASSPSNLQPVFDAIAERSKALIGAHATTVARFIDGMITLGAYTPVSPEADAALLALFPRKPTIEHEVVIGGEIGRIHDAESELQGAMLDVARARGWRSRLYVPLKSDTGIIGWISVTRKEAGAFADKDVELLQTFADQAVIAIQNVELFDEVQAKTRDLTEALTYQTGSANILSVIASSPTDVQPVLKAIVESACELCDAEDAIVFLQNGGDLHSAAHSGPIAEGPARVPITRSLMTGRSFLDRKAVHLHDVLSAEGAEFPEGQKMARIIGHRTMLTVPLLRESEAIGVIVLRRKKVHPFRDEQITLLQTFADQAVIAIGNVRMFEEVQAKTRDLTESLQQQTATADVLRVISRSAFDLQKVLDTLADSAARLCEADTAIIHRRFGDDFAGVASFGLPEAERRAVLNIRHKPGRGSAGARVLQANAPVVIDDAENDPEYTFRSRAGLRSMLGVPMTREGEVTGMILLARKRVQPFSQRHVDLATTFADQAVIAIENVRLFDETQEALERQTATADILKVIASSPSDVLPVFEAIAHSAKRLIGGFSTAVHRVIDDIDHLAAFTPTNPESDEVLKAAFPRHRSELPAIISLVESGETAQIADSEAADEKIRKLARARGWRSATYTPLMNQGTFIGFIVCTRRETGMLADHHVQLLRTFADQAVIAIENARLFDEVQAKTADLTESLQQQTATADVLKVISRSAFDLETVLDALLSSACRLCEADIGTIRYKEGGEFRLAATFGCTPEWIEHFRRYSTKPDRSSVFGRTIAEGHIVHIPDLLADPDYKRPEAQKLVGFKAALGVPLAREGEAFGVISLFRFNVSSFEDRQIELVQTFADQAVIAIENVRLFNETREALERQTATAEILNVIASSPTDVQPVFDAIAASGQRLVGGFSTSVLSIVGDMLHLSAFTPTNPSADAALKASFPRPLSWESWNERIRSGETIEIPDVETDPIVPESLRATWRTRGFRSLLLVPLMRSKTTIGMITATRAQPGTFASHHIQLLQTFADQAVIAIENTRLFNEVQAKTRDLSEALTYQTGSGNILSVIASSPTDVGPVLKAIVESACELCDAVDAIVLLKDGDFLRFSEHHGPIPIGFEKWPINRHWTAGRAFLDRKAVHLCDLLSDEGDDFPDSQELARQAGHRSVLSVPLLRENESIGVIALRRTVVRPFSDKQIKLLQTFADQAVIAIGNVRMFEEVQAKTHDLSEALQQQTATADVLQTISSSPGDLAPVFEKMLVNAMRVCSAKFGSMLLAENGSMRPAAQYNVPAEFAAARGDRVLTPPPRSALAKAISTKQVVHVADMRTTAGYLERAPASVELVELGGARTAAIVPMLRDDEVIGAITVYRNEVQLFSGKQIELLSNFAKQAVIAIENARLLKELREALQQQTATADVLKVISRSAFDLRPVFDTIVQTARRLCDAEYATIYELRDDDKYHVVANNGADPVFLKYAVEHPMAPERGFLVGRTALERKTVHMPDCLADTEYSALEYQSMGHYRSMLGVPLLREGVSIGVIALMRTAVLPFTEKQIELVTTFADQAVIAIANVRLFDEVQARTRDLTESLEQQTATSEVLEVISSSPGELQPVFQKMLENATRVCEANFGIMNLWDAEQFHIVADHNIPPAFASYREQTALRPHPGSLLAAIVETHQAAQLHDMRESPGYLAGVPMVVRLVDVAGARTVMVVPMVKEDDLVGAITIFRQEVRPFTDKQIALVENFTKQAVIAIENTRLLKELRERTDDLTRSLEELRAAQDRLIQTEKLASLGQLTAGIAHEIKNPLNFVNNFSALTAELTDELNDLLKPAPLDDKMRGEADELTGMIKDNLQKVVQHGKRADSIVKNMLLHSREGSREHRPADINSLLDESLNLAYHGARAEKGEFNITLQRDFDADAGTIELFPQEITRAFLNLIANGVYAATRRKNENKEPGFEPTLRATTKNLGTTVEIRIRDNGTGIPAEVQQKMFNPFFTTKPAGEGTGLGLSMTHDIIVKQHGGRIDVATEPGQFTEFTIVLPRNLSGRDRSET